MKYRNGFILFFIAFILQSSAMSHLRIFGVSANLILCCVIITAFWYEGYLSLVYGIIFGLLQDICFAEIIGPAAISYFIVFFTLREVRNFMYRDNILSMFLASVCGTIAYYCVNWGIITLFINHYTFFYMAKNIPVLLFYHFAIIGLYYFFIGRRTIKHPRDKRFEEGFVGNLRIQR